MDPIYERALEAARTAQGEHSTNTAEDIDRALLTFVLVVIGELRILSRDSRYIVSTQKVVEEASQEFYTATEATIDEGLTRTEDSTTTIWAKASEDFSATQEAGGILTGILAASIVLPHLWKTLLQQYVRSGGRELVKLIINSFAAGVGPDVLARQLRRYVVGAEPLTRVFGTTIDTDALPGVQRGASQQVRFNATRIAFTEMQNVRGAAEVEAFIVDPFIGAVQWTLSPFRGAQVTPDECDLLAIGDYYGLGPGIYPVQKVPVTPHPFDRCERVPVLRSYAERDEPKVNPSIQQTPFDISFPPGRLSPAAAERARNSAWAAMREEA